jgi:glutamine phosphoribosylpyrophosphate amidotransferase
MPWPWSFLERTFSLLMVRVRATGSYFLVTHVPDSIVRGTTSEEIIQMAKDVGAKMVIVASCAPPIR